jgi:hypothetical protein
MNRKKVRNFNRLKKCPLFWIAYLKFNDKVNELKILADQKLSSKNKMGK